MSKSRNALIAGLVGVMGLAGSASGQETQEGRLVQDPAEKVGLVEKVEEGISKGEGEVHLRTYAERDLLNTQTTLNYDADDLALRSIVATSGTQTDYGINLNVGRVELNLGLADMKFSDDYQSRASFALSGENNSFIEVTRQDVLGDDSFIFVAGSDIPSTKLRLEGTFDSERSARGVIFYNTDKSTIGVGGGVNPEGVPDFNIHFSQEDLLGEGIDGAGILKFGPERNLDARMIIGNVKPHFGIIAGSARGLGNNEIDAYGDQTFQFDSGGDPDTLVNYYGAGTSFLGKDKGDWALDMRFKENERFYADLGYRIGDLGSIKNSALVAGVHRDLVQDLNGARVQYLFDLGDHFEGGITGSVTEDGDAEGSLYAGVKWSW